MMKEYEFVSVDVSTTIRTVKSEKHREIIKEYAKKGYRYVGYIPTEIPVYGIMKKIDLIFEKDI